MSNMRRASLTDLVSELERQKKNSKDIVARSDRIEAVITEDAIYDDDPGLLPKRGPEYIALAVPIEEKVREYFPLTANAHRQLSERMGIPWKYYDRMLASQNIDLLARNINAWMGTTERRLVRVLDGQVRAVLSDRYRPIDNWDVTHCLLDTLREYKEQGLEVQITNCDLTDSHLYIRTMLPTLAEIVPNDTAQAMLLMQNSEVGASRLAVSLGMWRQLCSNGLWGDDIVSRVHLGVELEIGVVRWSEQTLRDTDIALFDKIKDVIRTALDPALWEGFVTKTKEVAARGVFETSTVEIIEQVAPRYLLSGDEEKKLIDMFSEEIATPAGKTQWGLANAFTRLARDTVDADRQVELERIGGEVLFANAEEFAPYMKKVTA